MVISIITCPAGWALGHGHQFHHPLPSLSAVVAGRERAATLVSWGARVVSGLDSIWFLKNAHLQNFPWFSFEWNNFSLSSGKWYVTCNMALNKIGIPKTKYYLQHRSNLAPTSYFFGLQKTKKPKERARKKAASQKNAFYKLHTFCFTVSVAASGKQHHPPPHVWANPTQTPPHCRDPRGSRRHGCHATKT